MTNEQIAYAIAKQIPTAHTVCTNCGELDLNQLSEKSQAAVRSMLHYAFVQLQKDITAAQRKDFLTGRKYAGAWEAQALALFLSSEKPNLLTITKTLREDYGFTELKYHAVREFLKD